MTSEKLSRKFYVRPARKIARDLLGKFIVRKIGRKKIIGKIVETEAYVGPEDKASHAYCGKITERNKAEYMTGGHIYIYLVYGMHWQLNISTGSEGDPECVLLRALEPIDIGKDSSKLKTQNSKLKIVPNGPGKLCRYLKLDKSFYGEDVTTSRRIWLVDRNEKIKDSKIVSAARIGIDYAEEWVEKPLRFYIKNNSFVSRK
jgi:DNA-3-methyladenine glycosylase